MHLLRDLSVGRKPAASATLTLVLLGALVLLVRQAVDLAARGARATARLVLDAAREGSERATGIAPSERAREAALAAVGPLGDFRP